jgi:hypothetical protein
MSSPFDPALRAALICVLQLGFGFAAESGHAQTRKPTANEIVSLHNGTSLASRV